MDEIRVDSDRHALAVTDPDTFDRLDEFKADQFPEFSDDDLIAAMFSSAA
jgi:hypothetical protein